MTRIKVERVGELNNNSLGSEMEIIRYGGVCDITVKFENGYTVNSFYSVFKKGEISNPYDITECGVGYHGEGKYKTKEHYLHSKQYSIWRGMLSRCYDEKIQKKYPSYIGCTVDSKWHNYQVFAEWYDNNFYQVNNEQMHLDKDLLFKGNKIYSPLTCVFAPRRINTLILNRDAKRGEYPIGVSAIIREHRKIRYVAYCRTGLGKRIKIGQYKTPEEAFYKYKDFKESLIKSVAEEYKYSIPEKLYNALIDYKVEITD